MSATGSEISTSANDEAIRAWDGPLHGRVQAALREGLAELALGGQLMAPASTWIVSANAPG